MKCNGGEGSAQLTVTGGVGPYRYSLIGSTVRTSGNSENLIDMLPADQYPLDFAYLYYMG